MRQILISLYWISLLLRSICITGQEAANPEDFPFFGFISAIFVFLFGTLLTLTVVAAPIGLGLMQYSKFLLWPFGNAMVSKSDLNVEQNKYWVLYSKIVMILYFPLGLICAICGIIQVACLFCSIIGIPSAIVIAKSLGTYLNPVNKKRKK